MATDAWSMSHPEKMREYRRAWKARHPDKVKATSNAWRANDRAKAAFENRWSAALHRARAAGAVISLTREEWLDTLETFGHRCAYCLSTDRLTQDHIIPLSRGGAHAADNVVPACKSCNSKKGTGSILGMLRKVA